MDEQTKPTVTIDGIAYEIESLPLNVRQMIALHQKWSQQAQELQSEFTKTDLAVKHLSGEISKAVKPAEPAAETTAE